LTIAPRPSSDQDHPRLFLAGGNRFQQRLGSDDAVQVHVGGRALHRRGQVIDDVRALDRLPRVCGRDDVRLDEAQACIAMARGGLVEARALAARTGDDADLAHAVREQALDQRAAEKTARSRDDDVHDRAPGLICAKISSIQREIRSMSRVEIGSGAPSVID
jgi:hypothetical protein